MLESYEINEETLAIIPVTDSISKIMEEDNVYFVKKTTTEILDDSCRFFGSSYQGRFEGTKSLLGFNYKAPIVVEEKNDIIFFPTSSPRIKSCWWISLNNIDKYIKDDKYAKIVFKNGTVLDTDMSFGVVQNQVFRATRLKDVLNQRSKFKK